MTETKPFPGRTVDEDVAFLTSVLKGDKDAINLCVQLGALSQTWDDLADGDNAVDAKSAYNAIKTALVHVPGNPFYQHYFHELFPIIVSTVDDWEAANDLEKSGNKADLRMSFVLRDKFASVIVYCAGIIGGEQWKKRVAPEIMRYVCDESFEDYATGFENSE